MAETAPACAICRINGTKIPSFEKAMAIGAGGQFPVPHERQTDAVQRLAGPARRGQHECADKAG
jgi:hypothetical protein